MAYRQTPAVLARLAGRRESILTCAAALADARGLDSVTTNAVATRARIAVGTLYLHYADRTELVAAVIARRLNWDIDAMAPKPVAKSVGALARALAVYIHHHRAAPRLIASLTAAPAYRFGIVRELDRLIRGAMHKPEAWTAAAVYGALNAVLVTADTPTKDAALVALVLRTIGLDNKSAHAFASKAVEAATA